MQVNMISNLKSKLLAEDINEFLHAAYTYATKNGKTFEVKHIIHERHKLYMVWIYFESHSIKKELNVVRTIKNTNSGRSK